MDCKGLGFFFQAEDGIRDVAVTGVQTCALPIYRHLARDEVVGERADGRDRAREHEPLAAAVDQVPQQPARAADVRLERRDRKSTRLNSSHGYISYAVFCLKKKHTFSRWHQLQ